MLILERDVTFLCASDSRPIHISGPKTVKKERERAGYNFQLEANTQDTNTNETIMDMQYCGNVGRLIMSFNRDMAEKLYTSVNICNICKLQ